MLKTLRGSKDLTQVELASKAKLTQPYLAELAAEKRRTRLSLSSQRLAKALAVPVTELLE